MKKRIIYFAVCALSLLISGTLPAQETDNRCNKTELGFKFLPQFSSFAMQTNNGVTVLGTETHGYGAGISLMRNFNNHIGAEADVIYNSYSKYYQESSVIHKVNMNYISVPFLLSLSTNKSLPVSFGIVAGPQLAFNAGSNMQVTGGSEADSLHAVFAVKQVALDFAYGAGFGFSFSHSQAVHVGIGFRGTYGVSKINNTNESLPINSYYILNNDAVKTYSGYVALLFSF